jgi:glycine/D-amino acid oxidase-like deaminating enzyme
MPTLVDYHDETVPFYCLPQVEIPGVKAGWHHSGVDVDPSEPRPPASEAVIEHLNGWIDRLFPHLVPEPIEVLTCLYTSTPDHHYILDTHPTLSNVVLAAGFSGHGFKFGPVIGELLADLLLDKPPALSLETFQLARFTDNRDLSPHVGA